MTQDVSPGCTGPHVNAVAIIPGQPDLSWGWLPRVADGPFQMEVPQDCILGHFQPSLRDWGVSRTVLPRTHVLGYSQPSLRDSFGESSSHTPSLARTSTGQNSMAFRRGVRISLNLCGRMKKRHIPQGLKAD